jgi:hypothetical protein
MRALQGFVVGTLVSSPPILVLVLSAIYSPHGATADPNPLAAYALTAVIAFGLWAALAGTFTQHWGRTIGGGAGK